MNQISYCPVCNSNNTNKFLSRKNVPVHQNLLMETKKEAINMKRANLDLSICVDCGFIFNRLFDSSKLSYSSQYNNNQSFSPSFKKYMENLVSSLIYQKEVTNQKIVEVGCGKGDFLHMLINQGKELTGYGFDPSYIPREGVKNDRVYFVKDFYGPSYTHIKADVVVCRHVIEHIEAPITLLTSIKETLKSSPNARVFFETPCIEWILQNEVIWDFFYEHCSYFSKESLRTAFELAGFKVNNISRVFEGQYLWLEAVVGEEQPIVTKNGNQIVALANQYSDSENLLFQTWQDKLQELLKYGKVALWGAGAKGVTFANLFDPEGRFIDCIADINPEKQGKFLPGSGHAIVDFNELSSRKIQSVLVLNPNYMKEIKEVLKNIKANINLIEMG